MEAQCSMRIAWDSFNVNITISDQYYNQIVKTVGERDNVRSYDTYTIFDEHNKRLFIGNCYNALSICLSSTAFFRLLFNISTTTQAYEIPRSSSC